MIMRHYGCDDMLFCVFTQTNVIDWVLLSVQDLDLEDVGALMKPLDFGLIRGVDYWGLIVVYI